MKNTDKEHTFNKITDGSSHADYFLTLKSNILVIKCTDYKLSETGEIKISKFPFSKVNDYIFLLEQMVSLSHLRKLRKLSHQKQQLQKVRFFFFKFFNIHVHDNLKGSAAAHQPPVSPREINLSKF